MVLHKRLDYGSSGHQVPKMPHVPRSAKGKRSIRKKTEDNKTCAIDLLAAVAGQLLLERENSLNPFKTAGAFSPSRGNDSVQREQLEKDLPYKAQLFDDTGSNKSRLGCKDAFQMQADYIAREHTSQTTNATSGHSSAFFIKSNASEKEAFGGNSSGNGTSGELGNSKGTILEKQSFESWSPGSTESCKYKLQDEIKTPLKAERRMAGNAIDGIDPGMCSFEDPMDMDTKPPALISSDSSAEVPHCGVPIAHSSSFPKLRDAMHLVNRDDDENSSGCTHPSTTTCKAYRPQRTEQRRIRKMSTSKYWKVAQSVLKDGDLSESEMNPVYRNRKLCYTRQRTQRCSFKRRKLFERCRISTSDAAVYAEGTSSKPLNGHIKVEARESNGTMHGDQPLSFAADGKTCYGSGDCHVKFSIKSFKVPELFVEIPENATVGSLKRTVAEAVTALLGGGLRVGVLLQGKKVRDDNKSLCQAGICHGEQLDNLGFTLEPNPTQAPSPLQSSEEPHSLLPPVTTDVTEPLIRAPVAVTADDNGASNATLQLPLTTIVNCPESDHDSVQSPTDLPSPDKAAANSKALVPVPAMSLEALAVVPLCKSRRSELVQRRIRRPFSVMEVEALVQAVEKLGTGRWRDVKIRAFDNAKHRTYVDLKDKWKTLVHTARIAPQQRRGEPVPQELLDRVLAAHAYWSQQQAKLQVKQPAAEACLLI